MIFLSKDGSGIVVETEDLFSQTGLTKEAESKGMQCKLLSIEDFYPDYRGYRYFDLKNAVTKETFSIDYILHTWEMDKKHHEEDKGTEEWFIH